MWLKLIPGTFVLLSVGFAVAAPPMPEFAARRDYPGLFSNWVEVGDVNGDGIPDLVADAEGFILVLFGNGDGTFRAGPTQRTPVSDISSSFSLADMDGDGKLDLVLSGDPPDSIFGGVAVCLGNGDGTFQTGAFYPAGSNAYDVNYEAVGDFNGDGKLDVVTATLSGVWLFTGVGDGTLNPGEMVASPNAEGGNVLAADFNGDGKLDLAVTLPFAGVDGVGDGFEVLLGNGDGTFQGPTSFAEPKKPGYAAVGIVTKGGFPSIVFAGGTYAYLYLGNGAGGFTLEYVDLPSGDIAIGDVNNDGYPDLVSAEVNVAFGTASGRFRPPVAYAIHGGFEVDNVVLADLRNDGLVDIVVDGNDAVSVLLNERKGKFQDGEWTPVTGGAGCGVGGDFNGDGKPDLAVNNSAGISILLGTGSALSPYTTGATLAQPDAGCLVSGDINGDGIPDLLVPTPSAVVAYLGNGDGTFRQSSSTAAADGYLVLADFNHDGKLDFASSANLLALGNGDGTFRTPAPFVASPPLGGFASIAAGDINNDGWPDMVLTNTSIPYNNAFVLLNNHKGGFKQVPTTFGALAIQAVLVDLNLDGNLDLILAPGAAVYVGDGKGDFTLQADLLDPIGEYGVNLAADLNGDGIPDILVQEGDSISIYIGMGSATYETPFYIGAGPSPGSLVLEDLHGQRAGFPDIVVPDNSGGVEVLINKTK